MQGCISEHFPSAFVRKLKGDTFPSKSLADGGVVIACHLEFPAGDNNDSCRHDMVVPQRREMITSQARHQKKKADRKGLDFGEWSP